MTEKAKKGIRTYCVAILFLLLISGITVSQQVVNTSSIQDEISIYDQEQNNGFVSDSLEQDNEDDMQEDDEENVDDEDNEMTKENFLNNAEKLCEKYMFDKYN